MRYKVTHRRTLAYWTTDPGNIDRLMLEAEKLNLPEPLYKTAWDIAKTVEANNKKDEHIAPEVIANYILRYALYLHKRGELVEAPPTPPKQKRKPKPEPEGGAEA